MSLYYIKISFCRIQNLVSLWLGKNICAYCKWTANRSNIEKSVMCIFHWSIEENYYVEYKYLVYNGYMTGYSKMILSKLWQDSGYMIKYSPLPKEVLMGKAQGQRSIFDRISWVGSYYGNWIIVRNNFDNYSLISFIGNWAIYSLGNVQWNIAIAWRKY